MTKIPSFNTSILVFLIVGVAVGHSFSGVHINKVERTVQLNAAISSEVVKLQFACLEDGCGDSLFYLMTTQDFNLVSQIGFTKDKQNSESFKYTTQQYSHKKQEYVLFKVNIKTQLEKDQNFPMTVTMIYLNRYINYPKAIDLTEDQKFEFEDNKRFLSPYPVKESVAHYKFTKLIGFESDGEKKGLSTVTFRGENVEPFTYINHRVHGVNNEPQVYFSEVVREIEVSHWGNIAITEFYKIKNIGPELKGEFSRVQYGSNNRFEAKNSWRGIETELPYEIWGLYYRDEVGNISTSKAYRDDRSAAVKVGFSPRFALLGGWKANWEIGYNLKTEGFLTHDGHNFQLNKIPLEYGLSTILSEKYTIKVILPEGVKNVQISLGKQSIKMSQVSKGSSFGYLDFAGRPTFTIQNVKGQLKNKKLDVSYQFDNSSLLRKPLTVFFAIFSILLFLIGVKRLNMSAFEERKTE